MDQNNNKEGVTVKQIEEFTKRHRFEVVLCLSLVLALFFSFLFFGPGWALLFATIGGGLGAIFPRKVEFATKSMLDFVFKQETTTQLILGVVSLIISIFLPPLIFLVLGFHGGRSLDQLAGAPTVIKRD
ncbi:MAG: hypothetical protein ACHQT8_02175 [Chlamydiales bacterium]